MNCASLHASSGVICSGIFSRQDRQPPRAAFQFLPLRLMNGTCYHMQLCRLLIPQYERMRGWSKDKSSAFLHFGLSQEQNMWLEPGGKYAPGTLSRLRLQR